MNGTTQAVDPLGSPASRLLGKLETSQNATTRQIRGLLLNNNPLYGILLETEVNSKAMTYTVAKVFRGVVYMDDG